MLSLEDIGLVLQGQFVGKWSVLWVPTQIHIKLCSYSARGQREVVLYMNVWLKPSNT
jgi:hypothetical protein